MNNLFVYDTDELKKSLFLGSFPQSATADCRNLPR